MLRRIVAIAVAVGLVVVASLAADRKVTVVVVEVPVFVVDKAGKPVRGLTADHFELYDNGKRQKILDVRVIDLDRDPTEADTPGDAGTPPRGRHILLLFDLSFSDVESINLAREAALDVIRNAADPRDLLGVATFSVNRGIRLSVGFTPDHKQVLAAVDALGRSVKERAFTDPLGLTVMPPADLRAEMAGEVGGRIDASEFALDHFADMDVLSTNADRESRLRFVESLMHAFDNFARQLAIIPARKEVVFLSRGFQNDLVFADEDQREIARMNNASESGRIWEVNSAQRFGNAEKQGDLANMVSALQRADCVVHTVDLTGARVATPTAAGQSGSIGGGNQGLHAMADGTGGIYVNNTNAFASEMTQVLETTRLTYVLTFQPAKLKPDGKFHKLKVKLTERPGGAEIYHRAGYAAPRGFNELGGAEKRLQLAGKLLSSESSGEIATAVLATPFPMTPGKTWVPFLLEIDGRGLLEGALGNTVAAQIFVYVVADDGSVGDFLTQTVGVKLDQARAVMERTGLKYYGTLDLAPGTYTMRVLVVDARDGRSGLTIVPLHVPAAADRPQLLPPLFPDERGTWVLSREGQGDAENTEPFPFVFDGASSIPGIRPALRTGSARSLYLVGRGLGVQPAFRVRFLDGSDAVVEEQTLQARRAASGLGQFEVWAAELTPAADAGDYRLEVDVVDLPGATARLDVDVIR